MSEVNTNAGNVRLIGGRVCLDFVNTVDSHLKAEPKEYLKTYADLVQWSVHAGALDGTRADGLLRMTGPQPEAATAVLAQAQNLRAALYRVFTAIIGGDAPDPSALGVLNAALERAPSRTRLALTGGGFVWDWEPRPTALDPMLWAVAWSAAELLTSPAVAQVRQCVGPGCSWQFLDTSRNNSRRWCSMEDCGNRVKAQRHYSRRLKAEG